MSMMESPGHLVDLLFFRIFSSYHLCLIVGPAPSFHTVRKDEKGSLIDASVKLPRLAASSPRSARWVGLLLTPQDLGRVRAGVLRSVLAVVPVSSENPSTTSKLGDFAAWTGSLLTGVTYAALSCWALFYSLCPSLPLECLRVLHTWSPLGELFVK